MRKIALYGLIFKEIPRLKKMNSNYRALRHKMLTLLTTLSISCDFLKIVQN